MRQSRSLQGPPASPPLLQQRLKKEISLKFSKKPRPDESNRCPLPPRRHHSLLLSNPLTKSSFSLTDALALQPPARDPLDPVRRAAKSISSKKVIALSSRQRCSSFDEGFFKTGAALPDRDPPPQVRRAVHSSLELAAGAAVAAVAAGVGAGGERRSNKFKLVLRERSPQYKSASERKIARIESKIKALRQKRSYLESLLPVEKPRAAAVRAAGRRYAGGEEEFRERTGRLANQLVRTVELFFNMYTHDNIVGGHFRKVEGYGRRVREVLMLDDARARRLAAPAEITRHFRAFGEAAEGRGVE